MEAVFDLAYPVGLVWAAAVLLRRRRPFCLRMGASVLILALSWACLLVPRGLEALLGTDLRLWLGLGRLGRTVLTAVWIFLLYRLWERIWSPDIRDRLMLLVCSAGLLVALLALVPPENRWTEDGFSLLWSSFSSGGLVLAGAVPAVLWHSTRRREPGLEQVWLLLLIWLLLEIPRSAAGLFPILDWLLLPQAACCFGIALCFLRQSAPR